MTIMKRTFDYSVFIGRFQPFHNGHLSACKQALQQSKHLIILIGSSFAAPNIRNPFSFEQRRDMVGNNLRAAGYFDFTILPIRDYYYSDNAWVAEIQRLVQTISGDNANIALLGHKKDHTSYYLDFFPQWTFVNIESDFLTNATDVRVDFFENYSSIFKRTDEHPSGENCPQRVKRKVPQATLDLLNKFQETKAFKLLQQEFNEMDDYKKAWSKAPYPPVFVTTDAVVTCCGHILLVTRKGSPGKGLYALPGGFIGQNQRLEDSCLRELREETKIKVPLPVLRGSITGRNVFDHPLRSVRGRTITHAFYIQLKDIELPKVKGDDDAESAAWYPLSWVQSNQDKMFEDHSSIIESFIGRSSK